MGNIDTKELLIHAGASFIGKCNMPDRKDKNLGEEKESFSVEVEPDDLDDSDKEIAEEAEKK
jgi:cytoskeletal protein CcmA (bactofilin family)